MLTIAEFVELMRSFQESRLLLSAVELDIFSAVGNGGTAAEISARLGTDARATELFLNALAAVGALHKQNGRFQNTPHTARHLVAGSPDYARPALMHTVNMWNSWSSLSDAIRGGTAKIEPVAESRDAAATEAFIAAMHRNAQTYAADVVRAVGAESVRRMLDVGGGSGAYSIAFATANPDVHAEVFDLPWVLPITNRHIDESGLTGRVVTRPGDLTGDVLGEGYDLILVSAICHMLNPQQNLDLFRRCRNALVPEGRLVVRDFILDPARTSPRPAAVFALHMLVNTREGSVYSEEEYRRWLESAGFQRTVRPKGDGDLLIATPSR